MTRLGLHALTHHQDSTVPFDDRGSPHSLAHALETGTPDVPATRQQRECGAVGQRRCIVGGLCGIAGLPVCRSGLPPNRGTQDRGEPFGCFQPGIVSGVREDADLAAQSCSQTPQGISGAAVAGTADDHRARWQVLTKFVHMGFERVDLFGGVELAVHHVVDRP